MGPPPPPSTYAAIGMTKPLKGKIPRWPFVAASLPIPSFVAKMQATPRAPYQTPGTPRFAKKPLGASNSIIPKNPK
jgi:hypothetical protein